MVVEVTTLVGRTLDPDFLALLRVPVRRGGEDYPEMGDGETRERMWRMFCDLRDDQNISRLPDDWKIHVQDVDLERTRDTHSFYACKACTMFC